MALAIAAVAAWIFLYLLQPSISSCESAVRSGDRRRGIEICRASYERTQDEHHLAWAAQAYMYLDELDEAENLAHRLLAGPLVGDGHRILSYVTYRRGLGSVARMHASVALAIHTVAGDQSSMTSDALLLSHAAWKVGDFTASLGAADEALRLARQLRSRRNEVAAYLARADALRRMGDTRGAATTLASAIERATDPCDKVWAHLKSGMCRMEAGQDDLAMLELTAAAQANGACRSEDVSSSVAINRAWLLRRRDPSGALARLDEIPRSEQEAVEILLLRGYLAADRGDLAESDRYLARAAALEPPDADWPWEIERARAELSELSNGPDADSLAESHYRRAVAMVAALRGSARSRSAHLVSSHRGPYDGLISLLARHRRWRDVLAVILDLDASDMLRATADEVVSRDRAPLEMDTPEPRSIIAPPTVEDVLLAWRSRDLVIVIAPSRRGIGTAGERAYRLHITDGQVTGQEVADADAARRWADDLFVDPDNRAAARALGRIIVPAGAADGTLDVLAVGPLGKVPLAALRDDDGSLIIGQRPLARVLALQATGPESDGAARSVILADPRGDLPGAAVEGAVVADAVGSGAQLSGARASSAATRAQLWAAHRAALLHVAGHVGMHGRWRALRLADGEVDPAEIVQRRLAPRIAVLAGCGSAAAMDEEGWGSIAAALLDSGTAVVIATDRSVRDATSLSVMRDFYTQVDWRTDPTRALASVQRALDARAATSTDPVTTARSWAAFSVLRRPPVVSRHQKP